MNMLPSITPAQARLPRTYEAAREALAECQSVDECKDWADKAAWLAAARKSFRPGPRQACGVCGRHKAIAQAHHLVPLARQYARGAVVPDQRAVWLCPNHHSAVHLLLSQASGQRVEASRSVISLIGELQEEGTLRTILDLVRASGRLNHADALEAEGLEKSAA